MNNSPTSQDFASNGDLIGHIAAAAHFRNLRQFQYLQRESVLRSSRE